MAGPAGLPDLDTLPVFQYYDEHQDTLIDIVSNDHTHPRVIEDYVLDPVDWQAINRGLDRGDGMGPPNGVDTIPDILGHNIDDFICFVCEQAGSACDEQNCIEIAKFDFEDTADTKLQIRQARWGYGVFAWARIPRGTLIGEYLGRLMPLDYAHALHNRYIFTVENRADSNAEMYGNITRYVNHHCDCNTEPMIAMYGKRAVMVFETTRDVAAGEEITIDYGPTYFNADQPCQCDAFPYPHTSEEYRRRVHPDGTVDATGVGTYGGFKGKVGRGRTEQPQVGEAGSVQTRRAKRKLRTLGEAAAAPEEKQRRVSGGSRTYRGRLTKPKLVKDSQNMWIPERSAPRRSRRIADRRARRTAAMNVGA